MSRKATLHNICQKHFGGLPLETYANGLKVGVSYKLVFGRNAKYLSPHVIKKLLEELMTLPNVVSAQFKELKRSFCWRDCYAVYVKFSTKVYKRTDASEPTTVKDKELFLSASDVLCTNPALVKAIAIGALEIMMAAAIDDPDMLDENTSLKLRQAARDYANDMLNDLGKAVRLEINKTPVEFEIVRKVNKATVNGKLITA